MTATDDPAARMRAAKNLPASTLGSTIGPVVVVSEADRDAVLDELERLRAERQPVAIAVDFRDVSEDDVRRWREAVSEAAGRPLVVLPDFEHQQAERDADVRAVEALLVALDVTLTKPPAGLERRVQKLRARFAGRIAALQEREQEGGTL